MLGRLIITLVFILSPVVSYADSIVPPLEVTNQAQSFHPKAKLSFIDTQVLPDDSYRWSRYIYSTTSEEWSYGSVYILWKGDSGFPVWALDWPGDFSPHTFAWEDFNEDGHRDLFFLAGEDEVFSTNIYLWNKDADHYSPSNFQWVYKNENAYSMIMDIENDGHPEILDSGREGDAYVGDPCEQNEVRFTEIPESVLSLTTEKYNELVGRFGALNFTYNMPEHFAFFNLNLFAPIKILRVEGDIVRDVTSQYPEHLKWRLGILKDIRKANEGDCQKSLDPVIDYVQKRIDQAGGK